MTTPKWQDWRTLSSTSNGLRPATIQERILAALATYVTNTNPDGTLRGS